MAITYSRTPQVIYSDQTVGRISERTNPATRFPAHARPVIQAPDDGRVWRVYEQTWTPNQLPSYAFKNGTQWFKREQRRDFKTGEIRWETTGSCNPVAFSS